ncbi:hypothetical protein [Methylophilus sp. DW102]|uniref:hypothetical protein n=1 Tax=Methylophilus sp. DW102 TaxID=3095607 RepID=UPI00308F1375|nr:hypothetical protein MTDW_25990 [Methylophilus sp. DW102]
MNLIDTNCVTHIFESTSSCTETYFLAPEILDEITFTNQNLPKEFISIGNHHLFNEAIYIDFYKKMLNKHEGKSFFNMTGLGDISILATIHTIVHMSSSHSDLFDSKDITVFTEDIRLIKKLKKEFLTSSVTLKRFKDIR